MTGKGLTVALSMLSVTSASYSLAQSMVNPALDTLRQTLHTDQVGVSWVLTSYLLASALLTPILGRLGDRHGTRLLLLIALGLLVLGSVVAAPAHALPEMVVGRVLQGAAGAVLPLAFGLIRDIAPGPRVGSAVGIVAAMSAVGGGLGLLVCGPIIEGLGVSWLFWLPAVANSVVALLLWRALPEGRTHGGEGVNWMAALLLSAALICLLLPLSRRAALAHPADRHGRLPAAPGLECERRFTALRSRALLGGGVHSVVPAAAAPGWPRLRGVRDRLRDSVRPGLGFGIALSALSAVVVHAVPAAQTGAAAGMNANVRTIGGALGAAMVSTILGSHSGALGLPTASGYTIAFSALAVAALGSLVACLAIPTAIAAHEPADAGKTAEIRTTHQERIIR
jgi:MFS family permease